MSIIQVEHLRKEYEMATPLKDVSVTVEPGEVISIIGPSGTGKSTFLRCLNGLETPTSGKIIIDGDDITAKNCRIDLVRHKIGMVFQSFNLFEHKTVVENVMMGPIKLLGLSKQEAYDRAMALLERVGLGNQGMKYPDGLSGGQKQRVAIARTLAMQPKIILFDEPTSALDPSMVDEVAAVIKSLSKEGYTILMVTHEMSIAKNISTRIFYMDEGGIYEDGTPEQVFDHPEKDKTRAFMHRMKAFHFHLSEQKFDFYNLQSRLTGFGKELFWTKRQLYTTNFAVEELFVKTLVPYMGQSVSDIELTVAYERATDTIELSLTYDGPEYNAYVHCDELSHMLLEHWKKEVNYQFITKNRLSVTL